MFLLNHALQNLDARLAVCSTHGRAPRFKTQPDPGVVSLSLSLHHLPYSNSLFPVSLDQLLITITLPHPPPVAALHSPITVLHSLVFPTTPVHPYFLFSSPLLSSLSLSLLTLTPYIPPPPTHSPVTYRRLAIGNLLLPIHLRLHPFSLLPQFVSYSFR